MGRQLQTCISDFFCSDTSTRLRDWDYRFGITKNILISGTNNYFKTSGKGNSLFRETLILITKTDG